jgi:hypothetical protein
MSRVFFLLIIFFLSLPSTPNAQYSKLLRKTEKEVKVSIREFPIIERDSSEHEMVTYLMFKDKESELKLICYFFGGQCYRVKHYTSSSTFDALIDFASKSYHKVRDKVWISLDSTFTITINRFGDKVVVEYSSGVNRF